MIPHAQSESRNPYAAPAADLGTGTPEAEPLVERDINPFSAAALQELCFQPARFFSPGTRITRTWAVFVAIWLVGMAGAMDRIDTNMVKSDLGRSAAIPELVTSHWGAYWGVVVGGGLLAGAVSWLVGGWWYRVRLGWSGVENADPREARLLHIFSSLIVAVPALLYTLGSVFVFPNYQAAWEGADWWSGVLILFLFWSCFVSYFGARAKFGLHGVAGLLWFLILPLLVFGAALGFIAYAYFLNAQG